MRPRQSAVGGVDRYASVMPGPVVLRRWTVEEYHKMAAAGVLGEDDPVQLLDGEIVVMTPIGARHAASVNRLARLLNAAVDNRFLVSVQNPVRLSPCSEPQPDLALLSWRDDGYATELPSAADIVLVIEVADSSGVLDRRVKLPLYAEAEIEEVWIVDLESETVDVHTGPHPRGYRRQSVRRHGEDVVSPSVPGLSVPVDSALAIPSR